VLPELVPLLEPAGPELLDPPPSEPPLLLVPPPLLLAPLLLPVPPVLPPPLPPPLPDPLLELPAAASSPPPLAAVDPLFVHARTRDRTGETSKTVRIVLASSKR